MTAAAADLVSILPQLSCANIMDLNDASLLQEVRLYNNHAERERVDNMAELYAILNSLECLEKVFSRDCVKADEYTAACAKLLNQYQGMLKQLNGVKIDEFVRKYRINCPAALERIREGRPMTMRGDRVKCVAEIVELFITLLDQINLNIRSVDDLFQTLNNLYSALNSMSLSKDSNDIKIKVKKWYDKFKDLPAGTEITEDEYKQIRLDISTSYDAFQRGL